MVPIILTSVGYPKTSYQYTGPFILENINFVITGVNFDYGNEFQTSDDVF